MNQFTDADRKKTDPVKQQFAWEAFAAHFDGRSPEELTASQRQFQHNAPHADHRCRSIDKRLRDIHKNVSDTIV
ncbi:hypothetical protein [Burkholderia ubonensis]|uniref:hypothetical protein n=1 Tax=Burkholderia ubonensis TaxID=101571 RepID=UPI0012FA8972|nr:hypothetical protein [Burkholderia ubonensis]